MKAFLFFVFLLLVVPMSVLNPMGRPAFLGYYTGVIATLIAMRLLSPLLVRTGER